MSNTTRKLQDRLREIKRASKEGRITREKHDMIREKILAKLRALQEAS